MAGELDDIRARLEAISEELADLALERLRDAVETGGGAPAAVERRRTRARRSVDKAAELLRPEDDSAEGPS